MKRMTKREIESRIKMEATQVEVPDLKQQILAQVPNRKVVVKSEKKRFNLAIRLSYIMTILVIAVVSIILINNTNGNGGNNSGVDTPPTLTKTVGDVERVYAKQAVTLAGFANDDMSVEFISTPLSTTEGSTDYDGIAGKINEYFNVVSSLIEEAECSIEVLIDNEYQYKMTVKYKVLNDLVEVLIYYNEEASNDSDKDKDDLDEIETDITGVIVLTNGSKDIRNEFYGTKEVEEDEIEVELTLKMQNGEYLKVSHEKDEDERDMKFEYFKERPNKDDEDKNPPYKEFRIDIEESLDGKKEVKVEFKHKEHDEDDFDIDFVFGKDGNVVIGYRDNHGEEHQGIKVDYDEDHEDHFKYDFGEGKGQSSIKKPHGHHPHDEDDREDYDKDDCGPRDRKEI